MDECFDVNFIYGTNTTKAKITIIQDDNCSIKAKIEPENPIHSKLVGDCYIESISGSIMPIIKKTRIWIEKNSRLVLEGILPNVEIKYMDNIDDTDKITAKFFLSNFPQDIRQSEYSLTIANYSILFNNYKKGSISKVAEFSNISFKDFSNVKDVIESICWLASFASGKLVGIARIEVINKEKLAYKEIIKIDTTLNKGIPIIYYKFYLDDFKSFVEKGYSNYFSFKNDLLINNLIHIGIIVKHSHYKNNKILLMSNFLEVIRYNYVNNICIPSGDIVLKNNNFIWAKDKYANEKANEKANFTQILEDFCKKYNIAGWDKDFTYLRNEIVHTGSIKGVDSLKRYLELHHFCDRIILGLLEWDKVSGKYIPINCPRNPAPNITGNNYTTFMR